MKYIIAFYTWLHIREVKTLPLLSLWT